MKAGREKAGKNERHGERGGDPLRRNRYGANANVRERRSEEK